MGRTMSESDEAIYRGQLGGDLYAIERSAICVNTRSAWAELDAERSAHEETRLRANALAERVSELERGLDIGNGEFISWQYAYQQEKVVSGSLSARVSELERAYKLNQERASKASHE